jgi:hypothetical protein
LAPGFAFFKSKHQALNEQKLQSKATKILQTKLDNDEINDETGIENHADESNDNENPYFDEELQNMSNNNATLKGWKTKCSFYKGVRE